MGRRLQNIVVALTEAALPTCVAMASTLRDLRLNLSRALQRVVATPRAVFPASECFLGEQTCSPQHTAIVAEHFHVPNLALEGEGGTTELQPIVRFPGFKRSNVFFI